MTAQFTAQGIASLGRYGDDLIVHMNQEEVQGLQSLAKKHGTSLTINPDTGMPEAFKLKNVFKALLPVAAGYALGPGGFNLFAPGKMLANSFLHSALGTGLLVGGTTAALTGDIGQGLMSAFGSYTGFNLGEGLSALGAGSVPGGMNPTQIANATSAATKTPLVGASQFISPYTPSGIAGGAGLGTGTVGGGAVLNPLTNQTINASLTGANTLANTVVPNIASTSPVSGFNQSYEGLKSLFKPGGFEQAKTTFGTPVPGKPEAVTGTIVDKASGGVQEIRSAATPATVKPLSNVQLISKLGVPFVAPTLAGVEPKDFYEKPITQREKQVYEPIGVDAAGRPTYGYVNASAYNPYRNQNFSGPGPLKLVAEGGYIDGYATGGSVQSGGIRDLYGTPDNQPTISPGLGGFGLGRLNNLASEQAMNQAQTLGYAHGGLTALKPGGYLDGMGDGMSDSIPATIEGKQPARLADGEFVVPADVVSHLGNGSSKAGSKRLYAMMKKVRRARTGNSKQGRQINPAKYMPA